MGGFLHIKANLVHTTAEKDLWHLFLYYTELQSGGVHALRAEQTRAHFQSEIRAKLMIGYAAVATRRPLDWCFAELGNKSK